MTIETNTNGVKAVYGSRASHFEAAAGQSTTRSHEQSFYFQFTGADYPKMSITLKKGSVITGNAIVEIKSVFVLGGTTPTLSIGKAGSEATDYIAKVSQANAQAVGTYSYASGGALAVNTPLTVDTVIDVVLGGTAPTATGAGEIQVIIPYRSV